VIEDILSQAKKVTEGAEVFEVSSEETPVVFEANRLKSLHTHYSHNTVLRIIYRGKIGVASAIGGGEGLVDKALEVAQVGAKVNFELPPQLSPPAVKVYDPHIEEMTIERMVELGDSLIQKLCQHTPRLLCQVNIVKGITGIRLVNSQGSEVNYKRSLFSIEIEGILIRDTDMLFVMENHSSCSPIEEIESIAQGVIQQLELCRHLAKAPNHPLPTILTPWGVLTALFPPLSLAFNGRMVVQGASPISKRVGEEVFDYKFSLWDDGTIPLRPPSRPWDDEGIPSQRTPLIQKGRVVNFLYDLQTAGLCGAKSTANAVRTSAGVPTPMVTNLIVGEGDVNVEEMIADMKEGLIVERLIGAEQGNILGGEFSGNVLLGYKVERGEIVGRVKDTMVSGNIYHALKDIHAIGRKGRYIGKLFSPHLYITLSVATKG